MNDLDKNEDDNTWENYWNKLYMRSKDPVLWGTIVKEKPEHSELTPEEDTKKHRFKKEKTKKRRFKK